MSQGFEGNAVIYCQGVFNTPGAKLTHGLLRRSSRFRIIAVIDRRFAGRDAREVLDGVGGGVPVVTDLEEAVAAAVASGAPATHVILGFVPESGSLPQAALDDLAGALASGLNVISGMHELLGDDPRLAELAREHGGEIVDVRRSPDRRELHLFSGKIEDVTTRRIAVLGSDSGVGKLTTAWILVDALRSAGLPAELVGTGPTSVLQGARYSAIVDSLIYKYVAGELEHAVWSAWRENQPDAIVIEGQSGLLNPACPGGLEILAAVRPSCVVLQHAPARHYYMGHLGYPIQSLERQIEAVELISMRRVVAIAISSEDLSPENAARACERIEVETGLPTVEPLTDGAERLVEAVKPYLQK